jgi:HSP20 family molecular chaperone IbpA
MFGRKSCPNCNENISKNYDFCPYCGISFGKRKKNDYGMLGEDDEIEEPDISNPFESILGKMSTGMLDKVLAGTIKMFEKEMEKQLKNSGKNIHPEFPQRTNFEIIINGKRINPKNIKFSEKVLREEKDNDEGNLEKRRRKSIPKISSENLKKISKLPKKEPSTNIRRLANKVIYELDIPGVNSIEDIYIAQLESSIEIRALAEDRKKAYSKLIPINLPIISYELNDGKLILELDAKN